MNRTLGLCNTGLETRQWWKNICSPKYLASVSGAAPKTSLWSFLFSCSLQRRNWLIWKSFKSNLKKARFHQLSSSWRVFVEKLALLVQNTSHGNLLATKATARRFLVQHWKRQRTIPLSNHQQSVRKYTYSLAASRRLLQVLPSSVSPCGFSKWQPGT